MPAERCDEVPVLRQAAQDIVGAAIHKLRCSQLYDGRGEFALPGPQDLFHAEIAECPADPPQEFHVSVDGVCFLGELAHQVVAKRLLAGHRVEDLVADVEAVVFVRHRCPLELSAREEIEHLAGTGLCADIADVVHTDIPLVTVALVGMGVAACRVVLLEDADAPAEFGEQCRRRQPSHARADDDGVIVRRKSLGAVTIADT